MNTTEQKQFDAFFGNVPGQTEAHHEASVKAERERIVERLVRMFEYNVRGIRNENPELKYFGDAPNYFGEYYLNEEVWNTARERFLTKMSNEEIEQHEYWKEHFARLDACKTQAEVDALKDEKFYTMEKRLHEMNK